MQETASTDGSSDADDAPAAAAAADSDGDRADKPGVDVVDESVTAADKSGSDPVANREASDDVEDIEPDPDGPQEDNPQPDAPQTAADSPDSANGAAPNAQDVVAPAVVAAGARSGPRHAASGSGLRLQPWMLAVAAVVVIGLLVWLVIGLTTGNDSAEESPPATTTSAEATTSAAPTPVDPVSLPQVLCMGQSYAMLDIGQPAEQLLADPAAVESQFPGSKLSTIPPGCIAGSAARDEVVLALGPFPSLTEACDAGAAAGVAFSAYEGSADTGLEAATCPPA